MKRPRYYPAYLNLEQCETLVVGGGTIALRKVQSLLEAGACVRVVSPESTPGIRRLAHTGKIQLIVRPYRTTDIRNARLVIGATDSSDVNAKIFADCELKGILVNIVDDPAHCRFIVPGTFTRGPVRVAIATGGGAPGVTPMLRKRLEKVILPQHGWLVEQLTKRRPRIRKLTPDIKKSFWAAIVKLPFSKVRSPAALGTAIEKLLRKAEGTSKS